MFEKQNQREARLALISSLIVVLCTCVGVVMNLTTLYDENFDHMGIQTFCMFTVLSNILVTIGMSLIIPFAIDGLKKKYFHLPSWLITFVMMGTVSVTLTFLVSLFILAPVKGFVLIFTGSRLFLHGIGPILSFIAFAFFISEHHVPYTGCFLSLIPVTIYAGTYYLLVVVIGPEKGGWNDFYGFNTYVPVIVPMLLLLPVTFGIACLLRLLHNRTFRKHREVKAEDEYSEKYLKNQIQYIAKQNAMNDTPRTDIVIPRRFIKFLIENTDNDTSLRESCILYLNEFLDNTRY